MYDAWSSKPVSVATGIRGDIRNLISARQGFDLLTIIGAAKEGTSSDLRNGRANRP